MDSWSLRLASAAGILGGWAGGRGVLGWMLRRRGEGGEGEGGEGAGVYKCACASYGGWVLWTCTGARKAPALTSTPSGATPWVPVPSTTTTSSRTNTGAIALHTTPSVSPTPASTSSPSAVCEPGRHVRSITRDGRRDGRERRWGRREETLLPALPQALQPPEQPRDPCEHPHRRETYVQIPPLPRPAVHPRWGLTYVNLCLRLFGLCCLQRSRARSRGATASST